MLNNVLQCPIRTNLIERKSEMQKTYSEFYKTVVFRACSVKYLIDRKKKNSNAYPYKKKLKRTRQCSVSQRLWRALYISGHTVHFTSIQFALL